MVLNVCAELPYPHLSQDTLALAGLASLLWEALSLFSGFQWAARKWGVSWITTWLVMSISVLFLRVAPSEFRKRRYYMMSSL